jgi:LssY-like putative type I secretion system component LssY
MLLRRNIFVALSCAVLAVLTSAQSTQPKAVPAVTQNPELTATVPNQDKDNDEETDELAPAAVEMDKSSDSPLIRKLYEATRETKEQNILQRLEETQKIIESGADVKSVDGLGRGALHWAVFGSSYATKPSVITAYEEIAHELIDRGAEINREDAYNDTALDYLLYSPNFEMQTLLLEHGATSGFFAASYSYIALSLEEDEHCAQELPSEPGLPNKGEVAPVSLHADLTPGLMIPIRLTTQVWSDKSRTGDPIQGVVTAPVYDHDRLLLAPGAKLDGTVLFAQKAPSKYARPRMVLDFSNVLHRDSSKSPVYTRVLSVDNARETVRNNEIFGIVQPHASGKMSLALGAMGAVNPIASYAIQGTRAVYGLSLRREVDFPAGTDMTIQVTRPSRLKVKDSWPGWPALAVDQDLQKLVERTPLRSQTGDKQPADLTNIMFLGTSQQVVAAFEESGWTQADDVGVKSSLKTLQATIRQSGYSSSPFMTLNLAGKPPEFAYQKALDTIAKRHHLRIYHQAAKYQGRDVWVATATHDIGIGSSRKGTKWFHRIDPHIDRERDRIKNELLLSGTAQSFALVDRTHVAKVHENATGDKLITDRKMLVLLLGSGGRNAIASK